MSARESYPACPSVVQMYDEERRRHVAALRAKADAYDSMDWLDYALNERLEFYPDSPYWAVAVELARAERLSPTDFVFLRMDPSKSPGFYSICAGQAEHYTTQRAINQFFGESEK